MGWGQWRSLPVYFSRTVCLGCHSGGRTDLSVVDVILIIIRSQDKRTMLSWKLAVFALGTVGLAYYLWTPLPDDIDQKGFLHANFVLRKAINLLTVSLSAGPDLFCRHTGRLV